MNGMEAKYTAKHIAKLIKNKRSKEKKLRAYYDQRYDIVDAEACDKFAISHFLIKEIRGMSLQFRAFMIHNAFKKSRKFTSAEVEYLSLGENALIALKENLPEYSIYMDRKHRQQKAISIVKNTFLQTDEERNQFDSWLQSAT
jgi:hypothetical protein